MDIKIKELAGDQSWLSTCIISALGAEHVDVIKGKESINVMLKIDDFVLEPSLLQKIFENIGKYITTEGEKVAAEKFEDAMREIDDLSDTIKEVGDQIKTKYNIEDYE